MASDGAPWADTPFALIPTPGRGEDIKKIPDAVWIAREMCCAHNGMLRSLNSIYQQSAHVTKPQDVKDLLLYAKFWCGWIEEHHEGEETFFFPQIETATGVKGLMATNVAQHHSFTSGLEQMEKYVKETAVGDYDGLKLRGIIEGFGHKLTKHLSDEIQTLLGLDKFDGKKMREIYNVFDLEMRKGDKSVLFPIVFGSSDASYEEGFTWPEAPAPIRYVVHYFFERKHQGAWRFSPATTWGERRPLLFTGKEAL